MKAFVFIMTLSSSVLLIPNVNSIVTMIDIGQGDSILIQMPLNKGTYLIDTGGADWDQEKDEEDQYIAARSILIPYLKSLGITKVDKLIITHGDLDHAGGTLLLMEEFKISELVLGKKLLFSDLEKDILGKAKAEGIHIHYAKEGDYWETLGGRFEILSPEGKEVNENDRSIVIKAKIHDIGFLFTGDISKEKEQTIIRRYPNLKADVLKVGHHGSNTSTSNIFLRKLNPSYALISVGRKNWYGHPHKEVLERLATEEIQVLRTDENGAIQIKINPFFGGTIRTKMP
ncbi:hypothetical protein GCM10008967_34110 [Bacillus carboniphilus]|uniref:Metallo-beta-lactamase domain-containing protein n=1 Tax=Bacillus carboniphilus TaxID=86663 RepID=A0ABP3GB05_9BACI